MSPNNTELLKQRLILIKKTSGLYLSTGEYGLVEDLLAKIEYEQALILKADNYIIQKLTAQLYKIEGSLKLAREKYVEAIEIYSKSNKILDKLFSEEPNDLEVAKVIFGNHMNIGFVYLRLKKADVALHSFKNGESIISKIQATIPDEPELSEMKLQLNKNLFDFYLNASQLGTALKIIDESLALFTSHESAISDDVFYSHIVNAAGVSYSLGKYQKAANYYTIYFKKIGIYNIANTTNKKELLTNRSIAYVQWAWLNLLAGKYDEVKDKLKVLVGYLSLEDKNRLLINANLAHAYLLSGEYKRAYDIYKLNMNTQVNKTQTFKDAVIADFDKLRSNNITHPQMEYIEKELLSLLKPLDSN
jgi:tetratricopeptide (TPR) repeat protein